MAGNTGYQIAGGSQTVVLPNYTAFGTEVSVQKSWQSIWLRAMPLLAKIKDGGSKWNKGANTNGTQVLIPLEMADMSTAAAGVAAANELTGITPFVTNGFSQAAYLTTHLRGAFWVRNSEQTQINNSRGNYMQGKVNQLVSSFYNAMADQLSGTSADSETSLVGIQQVLATANTVGGIDQSANSDWQSNVTTGVGAFTLDALDAGIDAATVRMGKVDLILLSYTSSNNLFAKLRAALAPAERLVNQEFHAKYGYTNIDYLGATCVMDNRLSSGVIAGVDSSTWYYIGDEAPKLHHVQAVPGADAMEHVYALFACAACADPAKSFKLTGVS